MIYSLLSFSDHSMHHGHPRCRISLLLPHSPSNRHASPSLRRPSVERQSWHEEVSQILLPYMLVEISLLLDSLHSQTEILQAALARSYAPIVANQITQKMCVKEGEMEKPRSEREARVKHMSLPRHHPLILYYRHLQLRQIVVCMIWLISPPPHLVL